ncbi:MAG: hypothetical protein COV35_08370 [Alphaproteobacteria bacterium CG11_big_fil_rev_8_21_14_0_20_39_49]|nr:MAG: hypothetical protein COV35_08370 [Alphaproteobacteria bacterium CG11_big_fil_rev_8_21_14_0_20_39_49]
MVKNYICFLCKLDYKQGMKFIQTFLVLNVLSVFAYSNAFAQDNSSLEEVVNNNIKSKKDRSYFTLTVENDLFGAGTDQNYTSGIRLSWFELGKKPPGVTENLEKIFPWLEINDVTSVSYSIGQGMYTPDRIDKVAQDDSDRPWAAFLYGSMAMVTIKDNYVDDYEVTLGVIGPLALGEEGQKGVHKLIESPEPKGWDNQLKNEPGLILAWQRRWPEALSAELGNYVAAIEPHFGFSLGNVYTYANTGGIVKFSHKNNRLQDKPLLVKPSMPGTGYFPTPAKFDWQLFAGLEGRAIARNIFLDGNTFADSHSIDKEYFVLDASAGVSFTVGNARISYTTVYRTKEFEDQNKDSIFGAVSVGYNF